jgi:hypothetical protein
MSHGLVCIFGDTIASGASTSVGVDLSRSWQSVNLQIGTMSTGVNLNVQATVASGSTYYTVYQPTINSATVATNSFVVSSGVGVGGGITPIPAGFRYMRFVGTGVVSGGVIFKVICSDL